MLKSDRFGMEIDLWNKIGEIMEMLKSDRFGMEIKEFYLVGSGIVYSVKIRPFRYGNPFIFKNSYNFVGLLKSDRFGMEIVIVFFYFNI